MTQFSGKRFVSVFSLIVALTGCDPLPPLENNSDGGMMNSDAMTPDAGPECFDPHTGDPTGECDEDAGVDPDGGTTTTVTVTAVINDGRKIVITGSSTPMDCSKPVVVAPNSLVAIPGTTVTVSADGMTATATGVPRNTGASIRLCHSMADGSGLDIAHTASVAGTACVLTSTAAGWNLFKSITASAGTVGVTDPTHTLAACRMQVR